MFDKVLLIFYTFSGFVKELPLGPHQRGQSLIEYVSIVTLIMVGMIIGKAVLDRGTKAGIKNLTDSVEYSDLEILKQADSDIDITCNCQPWQDAGCGGTASGALFPPGCSCLQTEMLRTKVCTPAGCSQPACECVPAAQCCLPWVLNGTAGNSCGVNAQLNPNAADAGVDCQTPPAPSCPHHSAGCPDNQGLCVEVCGTQSNYACKGSGACPDTVACQFTCTGNLSNADKCANPPIGNNDDKRLRATLPYNLGNDSSVCVVPPPGPCPFLPAGQGQCCRAYCEAGFQVYGSYPNEHCDCASGLTWNAAQQACICTDLWKVLRPLNPGCPSAARCLQDDGSSPGACNSDRCGRGYK